MDIVTKIPIREINRKETKMPRALMIFTTHSHNHGTIYILVNDREYGVSVFDLEKALKNARNI